MLAGHVIALQQTGTCPDKPVPPSFLLDRSLFFPRPISSPIHPCVRTPADDDVLYRVVASATPAAALEDDVRALLADYFRLDVSLAQQYREWSAADPVIRQHAASFRGIRMLRQDPVENLFTFICSSCNNIARITQMVDKLCVRYGARVGDYHAFPAIARLAADDVEADLRALGFGYRARSIQQAAQLIMRERSAEWLASLRAVPYAVARANVTALPGVGPKVADCVCLMSLVRPGPSERSLARSITERVRGGVF